MITLTLPYPISANRYWRQTKNGVFVSPEAQSYKESCGWIARLNGVCNPLGCRVSVALALHPKLPADWTLRAKRDAEWYQKVYSLDLDNVIKVSLDALNGIAYTDDCQVWAITAQRREPVAKGALVVTIQPYEADNGF